MRGYLRRLVGAGLAYQAGDILSKGVAVFMLPLYTTYVSPAGYGYAETLLRGPVDEATRRDFLEIIHRHGRRLGALVEG